MAIDKRFLYYTSEKQFLCDKNSGEIDEKSIAFISEDGKRAIYTHGKFFSPEAFVVGTQTTSTNEFKGTFNEIEKLYDGLSIKYWLPFNGTSTAATLNLSINGSTTGAIPVYIKGTTRFTTHIGANNVIHLTYRENVGSIAKGWWVSGSYDSNSNTTYTFTSSGEDDEGGTFKVKPSNGSEQTVSVGLKDLTLQFNSGGVENTSIYTYNGKSPKTINIKSGDNVSFDTKDGELTISATDTKYGNATTSSNGLMTSAMVTKLNGIASGAEVNQNAFSNVKVGSTTIAADTKTDTLNIATGDNVTISADANTDTITISAKDTTYNAATVTTAGLMSAADKTKLNGIETGAEVNQNAFTNIIVGDNTITAEAKTDSLTFEAGSNITLTADTDSGKVTISSKNTTYSTATQSANGLMSSTDKKKLDGIETGANKYIHPTHTEADSGLYKVEIDNEGHVKSTTAVTKDDITALGIPSQDTNTWRSVALTDGTTDTSVLGSGTNTGSLKFKAGSNTSLSASSGTITISSEDKKAKVTTGTTTKSYLVGVNASGYTSGNATDKLITDTGVYLDTTAGKLTATTFAGQLSGTISSGTTATTQAAGDKSTKVATTAFVSTAISTALGELSDALIFKGIVNSVSDIPATHEVGWVYRVGTAGTYVGQKCEVGDMIICITAGTESTNSHWTVAQNNIDGAVTGSSSSSTSGNFAIFDGTSGKVIKDSGKKASDFTYTAGTGLSLSNNKFSIDSSLAAGSYGPSSNVTGTNGTTISIPQITVDENGLITEITQKTYTSKDTDTHYTTGLYVGSTGEKNNAATTNGNTYIKLYDNDTSRASFKISGSGKTTVTSDASGNITINSTDSNTTYSLSGALSGNTFVNTLTPSSGTATTSTVPVMGGASSSAAGTAGLVPGAAKGDQGKYLKADGSWATPYTHPTHTSAASGLYKVTVNNLGHVTATSAVTKSDITSLGIASDSVMTGASSSSDGQVGLVPAPITGDQNKFLRGDGTWVVPTDTKYTHPTYTAVDGKPDANATPGFGGTFTVTDITTNTLGHVTSGTSRTITIPSTAATTSAAGLMSAADKTKLDGIATGANKYTLPEATTSALGGIKITKDNSSYTVATNTSSISGNIESGKYYGVELDSSGKAFVYVPWTDNNTTYSAGTGISISGTTINNSGVRSISTGSSNGTISVNTNGTSTDVSVKGLGSAAYTNTSAYATAGHSHDVATTSAKGFMSSDDKTKLDYTNIAYGTCSTAAATAAKEITVSGNDKWSLTAGSVIVIKFSYTNSAQNPTFNVNGTGAKSIWYNTALITTGSLGMAGTANRPMQFMYDGTQFVFVGWSYDTNSTYSTYSLGIGYGTCATAADTTAKVVTLSNYSLVTGGIVSVKFDYNVPASATMNINSKGAKAIYHRGAAIAAGVIEAGDIATFIYSTNYHLIAIDRATSKATQSVDGLMSSEDKTKLDGIATGANKYVHPSYTSKSSGLYKITVDSTGHVSATTAVAKADITALGIPSQDTTYSVFTGATSSNAGTSGLVPQPAAGNQSKYLRGDGSWVTPTNTTYTFASGTNGFTVTPSGGSAQTVTVTPSISNNVTYSGTLTDSQVAIFDSTAGKIKASGYTIAKSVPSNAVFTDTKYSAGTGISLSGTTFSNSGVRSIATGATNGTIKVNTGGTEEEVSVAGLGSAAYKSLTTSVTSGSGSLVTSGAVYTALNNLLATNDAMVFKGTLGTSTDGGTVTSLPATHNAGWTYKVVTAGTYAGKVCEIGDLIICIKDATAAADADWTVVQTNIDGAVTGPTSSVANRVAIFDGTSGKVIKDSGYTIAKSVPSDAKFTDTVYSLPLAASGTRGGIQIGYTNSGANVAVQLSSEKAYVALTKSAVTSALGYTPPTTNTTYSVFTGATSEANGSTGLVPQPTAGNQGKYLRADGSWATPTNTTYSVATTSANGLMSSAMVTKLNSIADNADNVTFTQTLTSGTKIGSISINGSSTDIYCQTNTNTTYTAGTGLSLSSNKFSTSTGLYNEASATTAATAGWYRIATTAAGISNCSATFRIHGAVSGKHTVATIVAGTSYGVANSSNITVLHCSQYSTNALTKVRIVYHTSYSGNYAYLEVYNPNATALPISVKIIGGYGWSLVTPSTAGSVPDGYSSKEASLTNGTVYSEKFTGDGSGLTSLNASNISSGTIASGRLPNHKHSVTASGSIGNATVTGSVSSTFTGTAHNHTFTGSEVTSTGPTGTTTVYSITGVGSLPSVTLPTVSISYNAGTLSITHNAGSYTAGTLPTRSSVTVPTSTHTHKVTASGSVGNTTAGGSVSSSFTANAHNHTFTGSEVTTGNPSY